jgi:aminopeptidase N
MTDIASLTREEAVARAGLLDVERYDVHVDLRGLFDGELWAATSTIAFTCHQPGATTFVDVVGDVVAATLNGKPLDPVTHERGRLPLPDLQPENVLVVESRQTDTGAGNGILRTVDPSDKLVYVWSSFECDEARRAWACFDQPDLKAVHGFVVDAHDTWTVTSNSAPDSVTELDEGGKRWTFGDTPPLSTYVTVVNGGPFHEIRSHRGGHDLGLYCRQSLKTYLERDAEELFDVTARGLAFFGEQFGRPFGQERYDHVFVPNMGGAMENWGCVTWSDASVFRTAPTYAQRARRADILLHEMAHQWFGDLVTMEWWDDLWLNEAFATWASNWACTEATEFTDQWAYFLALEKLMALRDDAGPATHAIRGDVPDVSSAMANFDDISYAKGCSVLKQLAAFVGEDAFTQGLQSYFERHAWGNTTLEDLVTAIGEAAGRDLGSWSAAWLDRAGPDTLALAGGELTATAVDGEPRRHRLDIGSYALTDGSLTLVGTTSVETAGSTTAVDLPDADAHLVNASDLTFALLRPDEASRALLLDHLADLPAAVDRAVVMVSGYQQVLDGELASGDLLEAILADLRVEQSQAVLEPFLTIAEAMATAWTPVEEVLARQEAVAETALALTDRPDIMVPALRALAATATREEHFRALEAPADAETDLAWRVQTRRAALGDYDQDRLDALLERDRDPDALVRVKIVRAARPEAAAKDEAWDEVYVHGSVPMGPMLGMMRQALWQPAQTPLLLPLAHRYLDAVPGIAGSGMLKVLSLVRGMYPNVGDQEFLDRAEAMVADPATDATVRSALSGGGDTLRRMLRARGETA